MVLTAAIIKVIKSTARSKHIAIEDLAELAGISRTTMVRTLRGGRAFTTDELERIAPVLGMTVSDLVDAAETAAA